MSNTQQNTIEVISSPAALNELLIDIAPTLSDIFCIIILVVFCSALGMMIKSFIEKFSVYLSIRFFDNYLNVGTCIEFKGFFGTIKKITPTYILLEKAEKDDDVCTNCRIFRRVPIKAFDSHHKDFYEVKCSHITRCK